MAKRAFTYIGGKETDGTDLPAVVRIFEHEFRIDSPIELDSATFPGGPDKYEHAVLKLAKHKQFEVFE